MQALAILARVDSFLLTSGGFAGEELNETAKANDFLRQRL
jgi:hypothetical protein